MRTLTIAAFFAATSIAAVAQAAPQTTEATTDNSAVQIRGAQPARVKVDAAQFQDYRGIYALSNGKRMALTNDRSHFYLQIDDQPGVEIVAAGRNRFVSKDASIALRFEEFYGTQANDVVVSLPGNQVLLGSL
ncbi:MAG: hypothetical protein ACJ8GW_18775 [Massilia sp.]